MWDFSIGRTLGLLARTYPFILLRMLVYFGITFAYLVATGAGAAVGYGVGHVGDDPAAFSIWGGVAGFGVVSIGVYWVREYLLYILKAGHVAVMVELMQGRPLPAGQGQIAHARQVVTDRFGEANLLFVLDQLVKGVIRAITGLVGGVAMILPIPFLEGLAKFVNTVVRISLTYVDEIILGYNIRIGSANPWETSRQALVLYAQNGGRMVKNAIWLTLMLYILAFVIFLVMLAPMAALFYIMPGPIAGWSFVAAIVFAWAFKAAVLEPFAIAALMAVYFDAIEGQAPNPEWDRKLSDASAKFRELKERAMAAVTAPAAA
ncbi:MAG: hypothetical protein KDJ87_14765 [Rhizobiaceae bacterium]|nr:hypothetical protein [Rhizobiaceae bacterium]